MSKQYYQRNKCLLGLHRFSLTAKVIEVGKGESVNNMFIFLIITTIQCHMFEIYTMVSEIHKNVDLVCCQNSVEL